MLSGEGFPWRGPMKGKDTDLVRFS
jgi:hypothetical protein